MEQRAICPLCKDLNNNCFVEQTEVEGEPFESYMCFQCGMTTNSYLSFDSEKLEKYTESHSELMNDLKIYDDERNLAWFPSVINMGEKGIIYPEGTTNNWKWKYAKVIDVPKASQKAYPIPDKDDEYYTTMLDVENAQEFENTEFLEACKAMGITKGDL